MIIQVLFFRLTTLSVLIAIFLLSGCSTGETKTMEVTASAYNSVKSQTDNDSPTIAAWGDELKPGMKCIAVSRDLLELGLTHNIEIKIDGLSGTYLVKDKMNKRWEKKIDIYMGVDVDAAREWGLKEVTITWKVEPE